MKKIQYGVIYTVVTVVLLLTMGVFGYGVYFGSNWIAALVIQPNFQTDKDMYMTAVAPVLSVIFVICWILAMLLIYLEFKIKTAIYTAKAKAEDEYKAKCREAFEKFKSRVSEIQSKQTDGRSEI